MIQISLKQKIKEAALGIRCRVLEHTLAQNGGYMGQACSSAEIMASLYLGVMKLEQPKTALFPKPFPGVPSHKNSKYFTGSEFNGGHLPYGDRFYLSPAQYALVLYATLIETGRMQESGLQAFNQDGSSVEMIGAEHSPGMEVTSGSLGQGLSQALGAAWARKQKGETGKNYIFMSDGEFQIGMTWEALQTISHYKLDNVVVYVDVNGHQCDGTTDETMGLQDLKAKAEAFGHKALMIDGHDIDSLLATKETDHKDCGLFVFCKTSPFRDLPEFSSSAPKFHYLRFKDQNENKVYQEALARLRSLRQGNV